MGYDEIAFVNIEREARNNLWVKRSGKGGKKLRVYLLKGDYTNFSMTTKYKEIIHITCTLYGLTVLLFWHLPEMDITFLVIQVSFHSAVASQMVKGDFPFYYKLYEDCGSDWYRIFFF